MKAYFLSDIHLRSVNERNGRTLLRFLTSLASQDEEEKEIHLFLLGDIFDLWLSAHPVFIRKFYPLVSAIKDLISAGMKVYFFEGNHDLHIAPYWEKQLGAKVYTAAETFDLGPWRVRCEHGDEINQDDKAYLRLRSVLRHPLVEGIGHTLPGPFWDKVGTLMSQTSRHFSSQYREDQEQNLRTLIREHAEKVVKEKSFDYLISGHMHVRDEYCFQNGSQKVYSINLGSWFNDVKILELTSEGHRWISLDES